MNRGNVRKIALLGAGVLLLALLLAPAGGRIAAAPQAPLGAGDLDLTFGAQGVATTWFPATTNSQAYAMAIQPDGKRVLAGWVDAPSASNVYPTPPPNSDFAVARYNTDGSLDTTFGTGGFVTTEFFGHSDYARAVAVQTDGKIIAAGMVSVTGSFAEWLLAVARYNPDGSLDSSFGSGGKISVFSGSGSLAATLQIQPDGKILIGGRESSYFFLLRYLADGTPDSTFGTAGQVRTYIAAHGAGIQALALQSDGKMVAVGAVGDNPFDTWFEMARYLPDGRLDATFGTGGIVTSSTLGGAYAVAIQADGKIVVEYFTRSGFGSSPLLTEWITGLDLRRRWIGHYHFQWRECSAPWPGSATGRQDRGPRLA